MNLIFPMAGNGTRTKSLGKFKPFIYIKKIPMLQWCLMGIKHLISERDNMIFITTTNFENEFEVEKNIHIIFKQLNIKTNVNVICSKDTPPGPAASVYLAKDTIVENDSCIVINPDQYVNFEHNDDLNYNEGYLPIYFNTTGKSSYVEIENNIITRIHEKNMITYYASAGVYFIKSSKLLMESIENIFSKNLKVNNEFYVGEALNYIIQQGGRLHPVRTYMKYDLGNIEEISLFENNSNLYNGA